VDIDWDALVSMTDFESKYEDVCDSQRNTPLLANRKGPEKLNGPTKTASISRNVFGNGGFGNKDIDCSFSEEESTRIESKSPISVPLKPRCIYPSRWSHEKHSSRRRVFDHAAIIFPSAFKHISGGEESYPHVTVRPSYFATTGDEEQILALTESETDFLHFENLDSENDPLDWLRRFYRLHGGDQAPLSSLLLARFESSIWESFLEFEHFKSRRQDSTRNLELGESATVTGINEVRRHLLSNLGDVLSHCGALNDLSMTIDSTTLSMFVSPFVDVCLPMNAASPKTNQIENVILVPMSWILSASELGVTLESLNDAVDICLKRMENHGPGCAVDHIIEGPIEAGDRAIDSEQTTPRRKKKKNKKKKVRIVQSVWLEDDIGLTPHHFLFAEKEIISI
jgi:hypothetical protein